MITVWGKNGRLAFLMCVKISKLYITDYDYEGNWPAYDDHSERTSENFHIRNSHRTVKKVVSVVNATSLGVQISHSHDCGPCQASCSGPVVLRQKA